MLTDVKRPVGLKTPSAPVLPLITCANVHKHVPSNARISRIVLFKRFPFRDELKWFVD